MLLCVSDEHLEPTCELERHIDQILLFVTCLLPIPLSLLVYVILSTCIFVVFRILKLLSTISISSFLLGLVVGLVCQALFVHKVSFLNNV